MAPLQTLVFCTVAALAVFLIPAYAQELTSDYYGRVCPQALPTIRRVVNQAITNERRMGASLLRLHFHDCFVNGCDGSVLLDDNANFMGEKTAIPNLNSLRGFDVVDTIKSAVDEACNGSVVSCADILAVAARDSVSILGGLNYNVSLGRRDARTASFNDALTNLPPPFFNFSQLLSNFQSHGLNLTDLVALSGGHTIGLARCTTFRTRIYNDTNIDGAFARSLQGSCPTSGGDNNTQPLDSTSVLFDTLYFRKLVQRRGLLHSDQELFKNDGSASDNLVLRYINRPSDFFNDFAASMIKMGNMNPLTGTAGEIRKNCRVVNPE
ncbi:hypothetical protein K2173_023750 [Erythroxylum novogranatense]|uniref:Peroxidase n=1 Tax=Erythroxylum novogranatense TaxID=1862640 RepID=A0AAV8TPK3_9ROSI|nr:hypothetical protein K2173_023750 [Erythroxylum novogranatense]